MLKLSHILSETNPINTEKFSIIDMSTHLDAQTIMPTDQKDSASIQRHYTSKMIIGMFPKACTWNKTKAASLKRHNQCCGLF